MIDFLPAQEKYALRKEYRLRVVAACLGMLSLALVLSILSYLPIYVLTLARYDESVLASQSPETTASMSQVKEVEAEVVETNKKIDLLANGGASAKPAKNVFLDILQSRPSGVTLTHISYDRGGAVSKKGKDEITPPSLVLEGMSADRKKLLAFKDSLSQKKHFAAIDLPLSNLVKDTDLGFSIRITLAGAEAEVKK